MKELASQLGRRNYSRSWKENQEPIDAWPALPRARTFSLRAPWGLGSSSSKPHREVALRCLPFAPSAARVDGDAVPPGRQGEDHEYERDDGGDQQKMTKWKGILSRRGIHLISEGRPEEDRRRREDGSISTLAERRRHLQCRGRAHRGTRGTADGSRSWGGRNGDRGAGFNLPTGPAKPPGSGTGIPVRFARKPVGTGRSQIWI